MKRVLLSVVGLLLLATMSNSQSSTPEFATDHKGSLRNIKRFGVLVEDINTSVGLYAPTKDQLHIDTELKLRKIGVYIPDPGEVLYAYLYININIFRAGNTDLYAFNVSVEFKQPVMLLDDKRMLIGATTWDNSILGVVGVENLGRIRQVVSDLTDRFLNDYLAANPKN